MKIIDFGESKDYFKEADDGGVGTMATIRGTPQYLSPALWKAHVEDGGNSRHVTHNIYKSDVFSCGLIFYQCAAMEDVTGFNQRNQVNDGERLINAGLAKLKQRYSDHIIEIIRLMLKFEEQDRPSFVELAKLVLTSTENSLDSPKGAAATVGGKRMSNKGLANNPAVERKNQSIELQNKKVSKTFSMQNFGEGGAAGEDGAPAQSSAHVGSLEKAQLGRKQLDSKSMISQPAEDSQ